MRSVLVAALVVLSGVAAAQDAKPVRVSAGVMAGQIVKKVPPKYPENINAQGDVVLDVIIGRDGTIQNITVISGPEMLRGAAMDAVKQWTYKPYLLNGQPVEVETTIMLNPLMSGPTLPPLPPGRVRVSSNVMTGLVLTKVQPVYPEDARKDLVEGTVVLHAVIGKDGRVAEVSAVSGPEVLRNAALTAARQWTYKPYLLNGEPMEVDTGFAIRFVLAD